MRFSAIRAFAMLRSTSLSAMTGLAYYLAAYLSELLTKSGSSFVTIWPPSGVLLAVVLLNLSGRMWPHVGAAAVASLIFNHNDGNTWAVSLGLTVANMIEPLVAAYLLRARKALPIVISDPASLRLFCGAAIISTLISGIIGCAFQSNERLVYLCSWVMVDLLGILIITPIILLSHSAFIRRQGRIFGADFDRVAAPLFGVALTSAVCFLQNKYPVLFVPAIAAIFTTIRLGSLGAVFSVFIITIVGSAADYHERGPFALIEGSHLDKLIFIQFYYLSIFASTIPVAAILKARAGISDSLAESKRLLEMAERSAHVGHWFLDTKADVLNWSRGVYQIYGLPTNVAPNLQQAIDAYHEDDRALVAFNIQVAMKKKREFSFQARVVRPHGEVRHVFCRGEVIQDGNAEEPSLFGIIKDITEQVDRENALSHALATAERSARTAKALAETDQLTGIANRRKATSFLQGQIFRFHSKGDPLCVVIFDIDNFKAINDTLGHQSGDEVLRRVASDAMAHLRSEDLLGRIGGEEFVIILPRADLEIAANVAERVRSAIEDGGVNPRVTISLGVAQASLGETFDSLLKRADDALYIAKQDGRNVLRLADERAKRGL